MFIRICIHPNGCSLLLLYILVKGMVNLVISLEVCLSKCFLIKTVCLSAMASAQSTARIEELLQEDQNVKRKRERFQRQSSVLSKLTRQLSIHDNRAAAAGWSDGGNGAESSPKTPGRSGDEWRSAFDAAANGSFSESRSNSINGHSRRYSDPAQNGDANSGPNSGSRRTPNRLPPPPPQGSSAYKY